VGTERRSSLYVGVHMSRRHAQRLLLGAGLLAVVVPLATYAQSDQVFKARADLVVLHANVFDKRGNAVPELPQRSFLVFDDDALQEITFFSAGDVPVTVGLAIDNSTSMLSERDVVQAGVNAFAESSHPEDEMFAIVFNERIRRGLPDDVDFTTNRADLRASLERYPAGGKTALYDAVLAALDHLEKGSYQKRVLVVLSDGGDNASRHTEREMLDRVSSSSVLIYTVVDPNVAVPGESKPAVLRRLAKMAGGIAYFPKSSEQLVKAFQQIAMNVRRGYSIGYLPSSAQDPHDGKHRVKVLVRAPGRSDLSVRVRSSYANYDTPGTR
jgi:Ca-activated chloride channel family protein